MERNGAEQVAKDKHQEEGEGNQDGVARAAKERSLEHSRNGRHRRDRGGGAKMENIMM